MTPAGASMTLLGLGRLELDWTLLPSRVQEAMSESLIRALRVGSERSVSALVHSLAKIGARWGSNSGNSGSYSSSSGSEWLSPALQNAVEDAICRSHWELTQQALSASEGQTSARATKGTTLRGQNQDKKNDKLGVLLQQPPSTPQSLLMMPPSSDTDIYPGTTFDTTQNRQNHKSHKSISYEGDPLETATTSGSALSSSEGASESALVSEHTELDPHLHSFTSTGSVSGAGEPRTSAVATATAVGAFGLLEESHSQSFSSFTNSKGPTGSSSSPSSASSVPTNANHAHAHLVQSLSELGVQWAKLGFSTQAALTSSLLIRLRSQELDDKGLANLLSALSAVGFRWSSMRADLRIEVEKSIQAVAPSMQEQGVSMTILALAKMESNWAELQPDTREVLTESIVRQAHLGEHALSSLMYVNM